MKDFFSHFGWVSIAAAMIITALMFTNPMAGEVGKQELNMSDLLSDKTMEFAGLNDGSGGGAEDGSNPYSAKVASVQKLYDVGEANLTDADIVTVNGVDCYVLQTEGDKAELITVDIYDQRFDSSFSTYNYADSELKPYMDNFYTSELGSDPCILDTTVTYRYKDSYSDDFSTYSTGTVSQKVFALDAVEAKANASKFSWDYSSKMNGDGQAFWVAAGCDYHGHLDGWLVYYDSSSDFNDVDLFYIGARPAFWISLS